MAEVLGAALFPPVPSEEESLLFSRSMADLIEDIDIRAAIEDLSAVRDEIGGECSVHSLLLALRDRSWAGSAAGALAVVEILGREDSEEERRDPMLEGALTRRLAELGVFPQLVYTGAFTSTHQAVRVGRHLARIDPMLNISLLKAIWSDRKLQTNRLAVLRVLTVVSGLEAVSRALPLLIQIARSSNDSFIRAKATLLAAQAQADGRLVREQLKDGNPRVRANAVEALWGAKHPSAVRIFEEIVRQGTDHHRVLVNAVVGLYLADHQAVAVAKLKSLAQAESPAHQAAVAWAMGFLEDTVFDSTLASLATSSHSGVAKAATRARERGVSNKAGSKFLEPPPEC